MKSHIQNKESTGTDVRGVHILYIYYRTNSLSLSLSLRVFDLRPLWTGCNPLSCSGERQRLGKRVETLLGRGRFEGTQCRFKIYTYSLFVSWWQPGYTEGARVYFSIFFFLSFCGSVLFWLLMQ